MGKKLLLVDVDAICGKSENSSYPTAIITNPIRHLFENIRATGAEIVLCGWNKSSTATCLEIKDQIHVNHAEISPAYDKDDNAFEELIEKFGSTVEDTVYLSSNPLTGNKAKDHNIKVIRSVIRSPYALAKPEMRSPRDLESREEFQTLKTKLKSEFKFA